MAFTETSDQRCSGDSTLPKKARLSKVKENILNRLPDVPNVIARSQGIDTYNVIQTFSVALK